MIVFLWITFIISIATISLAIAVMAWLASWARKGKSGSEIFAMALAPLFHTAFLLMYAGGVSGILLAVLHDGMVARVATGAVGSILLAMGAFAVVGKLRARRSTRDKLRVISQQEMLELIRSRAVNRFWKDGETVHFRYTTNTDDNGKFLWRTTYADAKGYPAYVAAATEIRHRTGHIIIYHDHSRSNDPLSPGAS